MHILGISLAVLSAAALSFGNIWQSRGIEIATARKGDGKLFLTVVKTPVWLLGTALYGVAILLQISSLTFAPLMLVQPVGVLALVFAVFLNPHFGGAKPTAAVYRAMGICLIGVFGYVIIAAQVSQQKAITDAQLVGVLVALGIALVIAAGTRILNHGASRAPIMYVLLGGIFSAFVASLGKTVIIRVQAAIADHHFSLDSGGLLTIGCVIGIGIASALSVYFIQSAYTCNASDVVVAGSTVVDPAVSVLIGIVILHEAASAPPWSLIAIAIAGAIAVVGVFKLSQAETPTSRQDTKN